MPTLRTRVALRGTTTGFVKWAGSGAIFQTRTIGGGFSQCDDVVGNFPLPNALYIEHRYLVPGIINGQPGFPVFYMENYPYENQPSFTGHIDGHDFGMPNADEALTKVAAWTNPARAEVSVPNFTMELREIPEMLRLKGLAHSKKRRKGKAGNSVAEQQFGWDNLFRDVGTLIDFQSQCDKRVLELKASLGPKGLRRQRVVGENTVIQNNTGIVFNSFNCGMGGTRRKTTLHRMWVSMVWRHLGVGLPDPPTNEELLREARFIVHGWRNAPLVAWNALPWSWFGDYFGNVGTWLQANDNVLGIAPGEFCVMNLIETRTEDLITSITPGHAATNALHVYTQKIRATGGVLALSFSLPVFSSKQLVNLAGIAQNLSGK